MKFPLKVAITLRVMSGLSGSLALWNRNGRVNSSVRKNCLRETRFRKVDATQSSHHAERDGYFGEDASGGSGGGDALEVPAGDVEFAFQRLVFFLPGGGIGGAER